MEQMLSLLIPLCFVASNNFESINEFVLEPVYVLSVKTMVDKPAGIAGRVK